MLGIIRGITLLIGWG